MDDWVRLQTYVTVFCDILTIEIKELSILAYADLLLYDGFYLWQGDFGRQLEFDGFLVGGVKVDWDWGVGIFFIIMSVLRREGYGDFVGGMGSEGLGIVWIVFDALFRTGISH